MTYDTPLPVTSRTLTLEAHADADAEERAALAALRPQVVDPRLESTIDIELLAVQRLLDLSRFKRLLSITPQEFGKLEQVERRNLLRAADGFRKRFGEISNWMTLNVAKEPELPEGLRRRAAI